MEGMSKIYIFDRNDLRKELIVMGYSEDEIENILAEENTWFTEDEFYDTCKYYQNTYIRTETE